MVFCRGELLAQQISKFSPMSICEALAIEKRVFADGPASRKEAEALFAVCSTFEAEDTAWRVSFVQAMTDHLLGQGQQYGFLEFDGESWLYDQLSMINPVPELIAFELMKSVISHAENASEQLVSFALSCTLGCLRKTSVDMTPHKVKTAQRAKQ